MAIRSYGVDQYAVGSGEAHALFLRRHRPLAVGRGVVWCHEHGATADFLRAEPQFGATAFADAGIPVIACDLGGAATWGNDTAQSRIQSAWDYLVAQSGCASDKVLLYSRSMGTFEAWLWALANPTKVAAIASSLLAVDLIGIHDGDLGGFATEIETAYGGSSGWNAAKAAHDPYSLRASYAGLFPSAIWYSTDDPLALPARATTFGAAVGATMHSLGAVAHTDANLDPLEPYDFLRAYV